jgi:hypothetical protein
MNLFASFLGGEQNLLLIDGSERSSTYHRQWACRNIFGNTFTVAENASHTHACQPSSALVII